MCSRCSDCSSWPSRPSPCGRSDLVIRTPSCTAPFQPWPIAPLALAARYSPSSCREKVDAVIERPCDQCECSTASSGMPRWYLPGPQSNARAGACQLAVGTPLPGLRWEKRPRGARRSALRRHSLVPRPARCRGQGRACRQRRRPPSPWWRQLNDAPGLVTGYPRPRLPELPSSLRSGSSSLRLPRAAPRAAPRA